MPIGSRSLWNAAMRSMSATSAAAAAAADSAGATDPRSRDAAIFVSKRGRELDQRPVAHLAEANVALLRREVARAQHGPVAIPVADEAVDQRARRVEAGVAVPRTVEEAGQRDDLVADLGRQREDGIFDVAEVLVEGRGRRADRAGDVDDAQVPDAVRLEERGGRVEEAAPGLRAALAERTAVERERRIHGRERTRRPDGPSDAPIQAGAKSTKPNSSPAGRKVARTRIPICAASGASAGMAASTRAPASSRSTVATTNGTRSLNGGTPF